MKLLFLQTAEVAEQVTEAGQMSLWELFNSLDIKSTSNG